MNGKQHLSEWQLQEVPSYLKIIIVFFHFFHNFNVYVIVDVVQTTCRMNLQHWFYFDLDRLQQSLDDHPINKKAILKAWRLTLEPGGSP